MNRRDAVLAVSALSLICTAGILIAGPLSPPVGPVAPSFKTLSEVEPRIAINTTNTPGDADATPSLFRITLPGSYYLTGNITGVAGKSGIEIASSGVTFDLNGFTLTGVPQSLTGIHVVNSADGAVIRNGHVTGWSTGIGSQTNARRLTIQDIRASFNTLEGVGTWEQSVLERVRADNNSQGMSASRDAIVRECVIESNDYGASFGERVVVEHSSFVNNTTGVVISDGSILRDCTIAKNTGTGGLGYGVVTVTSCTFTDNVTGGFQTAADGRAVVRDSTFVANGSFGISIGGLSEVARNHIQGHRRTDGTGYGIRIWTNSSRTNIHDNTIADNDTGIRIDSAGNAIYSNQLTNNTTHYSIVASNRVGAIVAGTLSPAISGGTGGNGMGSADPFANILY